jgi:uncharacterized protein (DUF2267 family)
MIQVNRTQQHQSKKREIHFLDETLSKTKLWLKEIQKEAGLKTQRDAWAALRAVLHVLRDRLPADEAVQLGAQMPALIRGMYYDGWAPKDSPEKIRSAQEFLNRIADDMGRGRMANGPNAVTVMQGVVKVLQSKISAGEMEDVKSSLPGDIVKLWAPQQSQYFPQVEPQEEMADPNEREAAKWKEDKPASAEQTSRDVIAWDQPE